MAWHFGNHLVVCIAFLVKQSVNKGTSVDFKFWPGDLAPWTAAAYLEPRNLFQHYQLCVVLDFFGLTIIKAVLPNGEFLKNCNVASKTVANWCKELTHWKNPWCWERLKAGGEEGDRGWDGWMASLTQLPWIWVTSGSWWWTGGPGVLQSMGSQRVGHDWATELNWISET